jgi:hypothetical protein
MQLTKPGGYFQSYGNTCTKSRHNLGDKITTINGRPIINITTEKFCDLKKQMKGWQKMNVTFQSKDGKEKLC